LPLGTEIGLGLGPRPHCVRWGPSSLHPDPPRKGHSSPHFSAHVYCGQTAGWIKIPLGKEVGLGLGDIVLDGDPAHPTERDTAAPTFGPMRAHWRNLANTIELMLSSAHPSPQTKRQIDRFSHSCTAHGSVVGRARACLFPNNCPFTREILGPSNSWFLEPI